MICLQRIAKKILAIDGIPLYMSICASQKYITTEVGELLHALSSKHSDKVNRIGRYKYNVDGIIYNSRTRKNEQIAIDKAINIIKSEFPSPYAKFIDGSSTLMELSNALKKMYDYLISANFNNKQSKLMRPPQILCKLHKQCIIKANEWMKRNEQKKNT